MSAQPTEVLYTEESPEPITDIPGWSGEFLEAIPRTLGSVSIHADDTRTAVFPAGWHPLYDEPIYMHEVEIWLLVCDEAPDSFLDMVELLTFFIQEKVVTQL